MNPFPNEQAARAYLSKIRDPQQREATRVRLLDYGYHLEAPAAPQVLGSMGIPSNPTPKNPEIQAPPPRPLSRTVQNPPLTQVMRSLEWSETPRTLTFSLPFPPSMNSIWRAVVITVKDKPQARVLLSQAGRDYRRAVQSIITSLGHPTCPPGARLHLHLVACPPDRRARDLSNLPKALEDALTHAHVWADDSLIDRLTVDRGPVTPGGRVDVVITTLTATLFEDLL